MAGWADKLLRIDLTKQKIRSGSLDKKLKREFIGGRGINSKILFDEVGPEVHPLSPDNRLIFSSGPVTGTFAPSSSRWTVTAKSPLTGIHGDANSGGHWGAELKFAGYDVLVFQGKSKKPSYLWIDDEHVELKSAEHLWGKNVWETEEIIREDVGDNDIKVVSVGPAGENLVNLAAIMSEFTRAAAKTGMATVMGSKNLKAIAVRGTKGVSVENPDKFEEVVEKAIDKLSNAPNFEFFQNTGSPMLIRTLNELGALCTKNHQDSHFDRADAISGEVFLDNFSLKSKGCFSCPLHCSHYYAVKEPPFQTYGEGLEFETLSGFGSRILNDNIQSILKANTLCNQLGLDTVTTSHVIALMMECFERGLVDEKFTGGLRFAWGDHELLVDLIPKIAYRQGFGDVLADGPLQVAEKIGKGAEKYVMHTKGLTYPSGDYRVRKGCGFALAVSTRGGDHLRGIPVIESFGLPPEDGIKLFGTPNAVNPLAYEDKGRIVAWYEHFCSLCDSLEFCKWVTIWWDPYFLDMKDLLSIFNACVGWNMNIKEFALVGERIINVEKAFNTQLGLSRKDDVMPDRFYSEPSKSGSHKGEVMSREGFNKMLDEYYETRGWDRETSFPKREKLVELGLQDVAEKLENKLPGFARKSKEGSIV